MTLVASHRKEIPKSSWTWDVVTNELSLGLTFLKLFGDKVSKVPTGFKATVMEAFKVSELSEEIPFYRKTQHHINGKYYYIEWVGEAMERSESGAISKMAGFAELGTSRDDFTLTLNQEALFFTRLMDNIRESVYFKDLDSRFIKVNKACALKFGYEEPADIVGKTDFDFFDDEHAQPAFDDEQGIIMTEEPIYDKIEKEVFSDAEGSVKWASTSKMPLYDDKGVLIGTYGITRDITAEMQAKEELKDRDEKFHQLSRRAPGFLYLHKVEKDGTVSFPFVSEGIKDILELEPEVLEDSMKPLIGRVHKDDIKRVIKEIQESVKTQKEWNCEYRVILPEKGLRWVRGKATPVLQKDGSVLSSGFLSDITEAKRILKINELLREQFESVLNTVPNLIFLKGTDGKFLMANTATLEFFGKKEKELIGKTDVDLGIDPEMAQKYLEDDLRVLDSDQIFFEPENDSINMKGEKVYHQTIKMPFIQVGTHTKGVLAIVTDITSRKKTEMELNETLDIVGEQNQRLLNFAHIVSHNLRNHAGNISMLISLFDMEESEQEKAELMTYLKAASEQLNGSIQDLNEIIDKQYKTESDLKEIKPADMIKKVKQVLVSDILSYNVKFKESIDDKLTIKYNTAYLESIILNLISNAIKYRDPDKKPVVTVKLYDKEGQAYLEVGDNGLGLDMEKHGDKLFGMYKTFHGNENSKGIGLFITKNQIESLGGSIEVESKVKKGTTFKIRLT